MKYLVPLLGTDFMGAWSRQLYPTEPMQGLLRSILIMVPIFLFFALLQTFFGAFFDIVLFDATPELLQKIAVQIQSGNYANDVDVANFAKSLLAGMFPAAVVTTFLAVAASHYGLPKMKGTLPLHFPKIGPLGWLIIIAGFFLLCGLVNIALPMAMGINPDDYGVGAGGLNDINSKAGLVEKTMASLASDKGLFLLAFPGAVLGAPLVEEVLFRGLLFAGLLPRLGPTLTIGITAALWAAAHLGAAPLFFVVMIFFMGILLGFLVLRFGSLWVPIACHTTWNLVSTITLYQAGLGQ